MGKTTKKFKMPSAYVIVFFVLILLVILTYFIPVSVHDPETGQVVYNAVFDDNGKILTNAGPQPMGIWDILMAPVKGFQLASNVGIALLMAGGFLNVLSVTGALEAGIGCMLKKLKGNALILLMNFVFALMGTVFGFWEEILPFSLVVIPMFIMAGYDVLMGMAVLFVGATVGNMAAVVNPFATGAAVAALGNHELTIGSGIVLRMVLFGVMYVISSLMLVRYGAMVKAHPEKSTLAKVAGIKSSADEKKELPEMTPRRAVSAILFVIMILILMVGYVPWEAIGGKGLGNAVNIIQISLNKIPLVGDIFGARGATPFGEWGFDEFSVLFFAGSILLMFINRVKVDEFIKDFLDGAKDLLGVVVILSIAKGIAVVMGSSDQGMSVTFVYWISNALEGIPLWIFGVLAVGAYILIGFAMHSTSGVAGISMPILGAVAGAQFAATAVGPAGGQIILISAFLIGLNFMCLLYPGAENLGVSEMYGVPYSVFLKFMLKFSIPLLLAATLILSVAPYIGLVF